MDFTPEQQDTINRAIALINHQLVQRGFSYRIEHDFEKVREEIERAGKPLSPFFWTDYYDFNGQNGFCFVLEQAGEGLAYICTQRFELGSRTLDQAYLQRLKAIYSHDKQAELDPTWVCEPLQEITGTIAYSGDAVNHEKKRGPKALAGLKLVSRLSLFFTITYWKDVRHIVGTIFDGDIDRGMAGIYGASNFIEMAERWNVLPVEPKRKSNYGFLTASRRQVLWSAKTALARHQLEQQGQIAPDPSEYRTDESP